MTAFETRHDPLALKHIIAELKDKLAASENKVASLTNSILVVKDVAEQLVLETEDKSGHIEEIIARIGHMFAGDVNADAEKVALEKRALILRFGIDVIDGYVNEAGAKDNPDVLEYIRSVIISTRADDNAQGTSRYVLCEKHEQAWIDVNTNTLFKTIQAAKRKGIDNPTPLHRIADIGGFHGK